MTQTLTGYGVPEFQRVYMLFEPGSEAGTMNIRLSKRSPNKSGSIVALISRGMFTGDEMVLGVVNSPGAGLATAVPSVPTRQFGTVFQPHSTKAVLCLYSVKTEVKNPLLMGTSTCTVKLLSDKRPTDAASNWAPTTERCRGEASSGVGLTVTIQMTTSNTAVLAYLCPAGDHVLLTQAVVGTGAATIVAQTEIALG